MILGKEAPSGQIKKHPEFPRMNPRLKPLYVISILTSLTLCLHMFKELSDGEAHPLEDEWNAIAREFYRYYLLEGKVPEDLGFLSEESKQIMEIYQSQFEWDGRKKTLALTFLEPVTMWVGLRPVSTTGSKITPETIANNSKLYKEAGRLAGSHAVR